MHLSVQYITASCFIWIPLFIVLLSASIDSNQQLDIEHYSFAMKFRSKWRPITENGKPFGWQLSFYASGGRVSSSIMSSSLSHIGNATDSPQSAKWQVDDEGQQTRTNSNDKRQTATTVHWRTAVVWFDERQTLLTWSLRSNACFNRKHKLLNDVTSEEVEKNHSITRSFGVDKHIFSHLPNHSNESLNSGSWPYFAWSCWHISYGFIPANNSKWTLP
jgi:hypothetical protein